MKKVALVLLMVVIGAAAWRARRDDATDSKLLFGRLWIDHVPRDQRERFRALFVAAEQPFGHFATRTVWTGQWEGFHYHVVVKEEGAIDFLFGATDEIQRGRYRACRCNENGFDYCLELSGTTRGTRRYYSKKEWRVKGDDLQMADQLARELITEK